MNTIEYRTFDKSTWERGEWDNEPDKVQWRDEETGLPCLIVRNYSGALCGYVGVSEGHPLYGKGYDESDMDVHGGLTFARGCADHSEARWNQWRASRPLWEEEAQVYPRGDSARRIRQWAGCFDDYSAWKTRMEQTAICHIAGDGEPDRVWWFGFDCAHAWDICPGTDHRFIVGDESYKNIDFVRAEIKKLALQLKEAA